MGCQRMPAFVHISAPFLAFQHYRGHTVRLSASFPQLTTIACDDSSDPVIYDRATRRRIVSKFPRKTWGATHAQTVCTRCSLWFFECLGTRLTGFMLCWGQVYQPLIDKVIFTLASFLSHFIMCVTSRVDTRQTTYCTWAHMNRKSITQLW